MLVVLRDYIFLVWSIEYCTFCICCSSACCTCRCRANEKAKKVVASMRVRLCPLGQIVWVESITVL